MKKVFWRELGRKNIKNVIFLHGWALNSTVWYLIEQECSKYFHIYLLDLPGYGRNNAFSSLSLYDMSELIWSSLPKDSILVGWSLGGLVASMIAANHNSEIKALVTVASTPCFLEHSNWPGISLVLLNNFAQQLKINFISTIKKFISIQTLGSHCINSDLYNFKNMVLKQPMPSISELNSGLNILKNTDLRNSIINIKKPFFRIYGDLDILVPKTVIPKINQLIPNSQYKIIKHASHAPFISHPKIFSELLIKFINSIF
uniref:Pimeloyl-[acyl-carrier protein] methyl ester esterase n=1 Tax=Candidatus Aschnera chinzeii TaxID=1485666 RepID=A0AAT9G407_9ENTR|nr:MAG: pimeloyl-ACP methyl ester esterase BioH [Candidatus Aschnera chinzeii]